MKAMKKQYGAEEGEAVFYASKNKGVIDDVERKALGGSVKSKKEKLAAIAEPFDEVTQRDVITARKEKLKFKDGKEVKFEDKSDLEKAMITGRPIYLNKMALLVEKMTKIDARLTKRIKHTEMLTSDG